MLNKFKIGTKLLAGFLLVLALLISVAGVGYYALNASRAATDEMLETENLLSDMLLYRRLVNTAQLHSANASLFRDLEREKQRLSVDEQIKEITERVQNQFEGDNVKLFPQLTERYANFVKDDGDWFRAEETRADNQTKMIETARNAETAIRDMREVFDKVMRSAEESKKVDETVCFVDTRVDRLLKTEDLITLLQTARYDYFLFMASTIPERQEHALKDLRTVIDTLQASLADFKKEVDQERVAVVENVEKLIGDWEGFLNANVELMQKQNKVDANHDTDSSAMTEIMDDLMKNLRARSEHIRTQGAATDARLISIMIGFAIVAVVIGLILSLALSRNITTGITKAVGALNLLAHEGDISFEIPAEDKTRADEIGDLSKAADSILNDYKIIGAMAESLANGDWRVEIKEKSQVDAMNQNLNKMLDQVNHALLEINESVKQVNTGAGEVSSASQTLSSGAQESAASLEEITASMSEISSQTKTNAESAGQARDLAQNATKAATEGQEAMQEMTGAMERITQNSTEIQRVIKVIDDIAFQTNLLALNAAVEAARAGVHGKGFAVVAEEVRNLAARSAKAAAETTDLISKSGQEIGNGGAVAARTSEVLNSIADQIKQTTDLVAGIAVASNEQAQGVAQVTVGLQQIDAVTQQNTAAAEESASAANEMSGMASTLQQLVAKFKLRS